MPESASALWRIVSLTAAKTRRIFEVSVAWVRLQNRDVSVTVRKNQFALVKCILSRPALAGISSMHAIATCIQPLKLDSKQEAKLTGDRD